MIHYVTPNQPVGGQAACGMWTLEHRYQRVTILKREVTCARCRKVLGLKPRRRPTSTRTVLK